MADTKCQQPNGCEGLSLLNEEEREAPAKCSFCSLVICDICVAGLTKIPPEAFGPDVPRSRKESGCYDGFACSEHFNEDWV